MNQHSIILPREQWNIPQTSEGMKFWYMLQRGWKRTSSGWFCFSWYPKQANSSRQKLAPRLPEFRRELGCKGLWFNGLSVCWWWRTSSGNRWKWWWHNAYNSPILPLEVFINFVCVCSISIKRDTKESGLWKRWWITGRDWSGQLAHRKSWLAQRGSVPICVEGTKWQWYPCWWGLSTWSVVTHCMEKAVQGDFLGCWWVVGCNPAENSSSKGSNAGS